jgi:hypothetical protein
MSDTITVELERAITFRTLAGEPLEVRGVMLHLTEDVATLVFRVEPAVYAKIITSSLFGLASEVRGEPLVPISDNRDVEIEATLRPQVAEPMLARGDGVRELVAALLAPSPTGPMVAVTESWQAQSVVQEIEAPHGGSLKSGYRVAPGESSMRDVARRAAARAGTPLEDRGDGLHRFTAHAGTANWSVLVWIDEDARTCAVYSVLPDAVVSERRADIAQYLVGCNYDLRIGAFEMDLDDGEVRLRTSVDVTNTTFDEALFVNLVSANVRLFADHIDELQSRVRAT